MEPYAISWVPMEGSWIPRHREVLGGISREKLKYMPMTSRPGLVFFRVPFVETLVPAFQDTG